VSNLECHEALVHDGATGEVVFPFGVMVVELASEFIENRLQIQVHGIAGSLEPREVVVGGIGIMVDEESDTIVQIVRITWR
jgi:hypothetical protein